MHCLKGFHILVTGEKYICLENLLHQSLSIRFLRNLTAKQARFTQTFQIYESWMTDRALIHFPCYFSITFKIFASYPKKYWN